MIPRLVVLEGADGTGKSTLAAQLAAQLSADGMKVVILRQGPPPTDCASVMDMYLDAANEAHALLISGTSVVMDRFHLGELVYGPLLRGGSKITVAQARFITARLTAMNANLVLCTLSSEENVRRLILRDGGIDDPKSGAKVSQSPTIGCVFRGVARHDNSEWRALTMTGYPQTIASSLMTSLKPADLEQGEWYGPPYGEYPVTVSVPTRLEALFVHQRLHHNVRLGVGSMTTALHWEAIG